MSRGPENSSLPALRVLIADDSSEQRRVLRQVAESMGCVVTEAADGRAFFWELEALRRNSWLEDVLVFADLRMPVYDGLDVLDAWQEVRTPFPFVLMTSFPDEEVERRVKKLSGVLLPKPFGLDQIRALVSAAR